MTETCISLRNIALCYKIRKSFLHWHCFEAIKDVSFDIYRGETLGLIGRNGAGKSSLLRVIAGIITPDRGTMINYDCSVSLLSLQLGVECDLHSEIPGRTSKSLPGTEFQAHNYGSSGFHFGSLGFHFYKKTL